jgi:hypothetical protein
MKSVSSNEGKVTLDVHKLLGILELKKTAVLKYLKPALEVFVQVLRVTRKAISV